MDAAVPRSAVSAAGAVAVATPGKTSVFVSYTRLTYRSPALKGLTVARPRVTPLRLGRNSAAAASHVPAEDTRRVRPS